MAQPSVEWKQDSYWVHPSWMTAETARNRFAVVPLEALRGRKPARPDLPNMVR
jgi:hypothetical protein